MHIDTELLLYVYTGKYPRYLHTALFCVRHRGVHGVAARGGRIVGDKHHVGVVNDFAVGVVFAERGLVQTCRLHERAVLQQFEVPFAQVGRPLGRLLLMRRHDKEHEVGVGLPQGMTHSPA